MATPTRLRWELRGWLLLAAAIAGLALTARPAAAQDAPFDLQAALDQAAPGATIQLPPGVYPGPITVATPLTLAGAEGAVIQGDGRGDVVVVTAPDVTLRGLTVRSSGDLLDREHAAIVGLAPRLTVEDTRVEDALFGIYLKNAPGSIVRRNTVFSKDLPVARRGDGIRVWYSDGTRVEDNHVVGSRDVVIWFSPHGEVRRNRVEQGRYGLHFMFSDDQVVEDNVLVGNSVGVYLMYGRVLELRNNYIENNHGPSGYGIGLKDVDDVVAEGNEVIANRVGAYIDNSPREANATVRFTHNLFAYNEIGVTMLPLVRRNTFSANTFHDNVEQVAVQGSGDLMQNAWSLDGVGNYWSDYVGYDADGDTVGDLPYASSSFYESLLGRYPELRLFQLSPAVHALDLAARAFPVFRPKPKFADAHPLTAPPVRASLELGTPQPAARAVALSAALTVLGLFVLVGGIASWRYLS